jgi:hypothetical protein
MFYLLKHLSFLYLVIFNLSCNNLISTLIIVLYACVSCFIHSRFIENPPSILMWQTSYFLGSSITTTHSFLMWTTWQPDKLEAWALVPDVNNLAAWQLQHEAFVPDQSLHARRCKCSNTTLSSATLLQLLLISSDVIHLFGPACYSALLRLRGKGFFRWF